MKFYLDDKFLFVDMHHHYTHAVVDGTGHIISTQTSLEKAESMRQYCIEGKLKYINKLQNALNETLNYVTDTGNEVFKNGIKQMFQSDAEIRAAIKTQIKTAQSIRVVELTVKP